MHFNLGSIMILGAVAGSAFLLARAGERIPAVIALVASALQALIMFRILTIQGPASLGLVLSVAIAAGGCWAWTRSGSKPTITAATVVALVGIIQTLMAVKLLA